MWREVLHELTKIRPGISSGARESDSGWRFFGLPDRQPQCRCRSGVVRSSSTSSEGDKQDLHPIGGSVKINSNNGPDISSEHQYDFPGEHLRRCLSAGGAVVVPSCHLPLVVRDAGRGCAGATRAL
jgi:hypothetical protein